MYLSAQLKFSFFLLTGFEAQVASAKEPKGQTAKHASIRHPVQLTIDV